MKKLVLLTLWVFLLTPAAALAAESFPSVVTGEADFTEGDLEKSRREAREDGLKKAVLSALTAELGRSVVEDNTAIVRARFLKVYEDFIKRSSVLKETKDGFLLRLTIGYELDRAKLRGRISSAKFSQAEPRPTVLLVWAVEDREGERAELPAQGQVETKYVAASWMAESTQPTGAKVLSDAMDQNGLTATGLSPEQQRWVAHKLARNEVSKALLRDLAAEAKTDAVVYLRVVRRKLPTPPAANLAVERVHNVAFILDGKTGEFLGAPIATPVVRVQGGGQEVGQDWVNRVLNTLVTEQGGKTQLVFQGISSVKQYDSVWSTIRKLETLGNVVPRAINATLAEFSVTAEGGDAYEAVRKLFPKAQVTREANRIMVTLPGSAEARE